MKKKFLSFIVAIAMIVSVLVIPVSAQENVLPDAVNGIITLSDDVTLTKKYVVNEGTTLTIDLNGHILTGPDGNYTIDNNGNLTIKDSEKKGKIVGKAPSSSCIRNGNDNGNLESVLTINNVAIESAYVAVKTEPEATTNINNSTLISTYKDTNTGTVMNWGKTTIINSTVKATNNGVAIYATSVYNSAKNSETNINDSNLEGKYVVYAQKYNSTDKTKQNINITNGELKGNITATSAKGSKVKITGHVKANVAALQNALTFSMEGTNIELTENLIDKEITVPKGRTLIIPEGINYIVASNKKLVVNGEIDIKGTLDAGAYVSETKEYFASLQRAVKMINTGNNITILKELDETTTIQPYANKNITIDLNGYTVKGNIINVVNTTMVITDSSEGAAGKVDGTITNKGTLTIENGNYTQAPVTAEGATTTLNGGTYPTENIDSVVIPEDKEIAKNDDGTYSIVYKGADYSKVDEAIKRAEALKKDEYKDFSKVQAAIDAVDRNKNITEQEIVDAYAKAINDAIDQLEKADPEPTPEKPSNPEEETVSITLMPVVDGKTVEEESDTIDGVFKGFKFTDEEIKKLEEESKDFNFDGYVFKGYYLDKEGKEKLTSKYVFEKDTTIYMIWEKSKVTVTPENPKGEVPAKVETAKEEVKKQTVKTGDNTDMTVYVLSGTLALAGLATILVNKKRKELLDK